MDSKLITARCICSFPERKSVKRFDGREIVMCADCAKLVQFECQYCGENHVEPQFCEQYPDQNS